MQLFCVYFYVSFKYYVHLLSEICMAFKSNCDRYYTQLKIPQTFVNCYKLYMPA